jgi:hypothetical protein
MNDILDRLDRIERTLALLVEQRQVQRWYDTKTVAKILGKSPYRVREWCRLHRVHAEKRQCGRGTSREWMIGHGEVMRIKSEGLLPLSEN